MFRSQWQQFAVLAAGLLLCACARTDLPPVTEATTDATEATWNSEPDTIDPLEEAARVAAPSEASTLPESTAAPSMAPTAAPAHTEPAAASPAETTPPDSAPEPDDPASQSTAARRTNPPEPSTAPDDNTGDPQEPTDDPTSAMEGGGRASRAAIPQPASITVVETELLRLINEQRVEAGLSVLEVDSSMQFAAEIRAGEALDSLSHLRPDGTPYHTAFDESGFSYAGKWHGENLAVVRLENSADDYDDAAIAAAVFEEWRKSPGHEQNMLGANFAYTGIGVSISQETDATRIGSAQLFASE